MFELRSVFGHKHAPAVARIMYLQYLAANQWLMCDVDDSIATVEDALALAKDFGVHVWDCPALAHAVFAHILAGRLDLAAESLQAFHATVLPFNCLQVVHYAYLRVLIHLHEDKATVQEAEEILRQGSFLGMPWISSLARLVLVQAYVVEGNVTSALTALGPCIALGERMQSRLLQGFCGYAQAQCAFLQQRNLDGLASLRHALEASRVCHMPAVPWISRKRLTDLYARALDADIEVEFVRMAIRKLKLVPTYVEVAPRAWPWPIEINTLGRFEILANDRALNLQGKAARRVIEMLKVLIDLGGQNIPQYTLCEVLWPQNDGDKVANNFKITLHRLRDLLGRPDTVLQKNNCLSLNPTVVWVDVFALKRLLRRQRGSLHSVTDEALWSVVENVHGIYRGPYLEGDELAWTNESRESVRKGYLTFVCRAMRQFEEHKSESMISRLKLEVEDREPGFDRWSRH